MSDKYKIRENNKAYLPAGKASFVTLTIVDWIDVFTRKGQKLMILNSLKYCQENKGLVIFGYCIMSSHIHMICKSYEGFQLSDILRDYKKFTSKKIIQIIKDEPESRREWMLKLFSDACEHLKREQKFKVWQDGNQAKEIFSNKFLYEKLNYLPVRQAGIHQNPVEDLIVVNAEDYLYSSARNYADLDSLLDVCFVDQKLITYG